MESSNGEHGGDTAWEQASPAAPTSTTSSSRAGPRRPTTTQRTGASGSRQTDRECVVGQADWIRFRDIIMTKIENLLYLEYTIS